MDVAFEELEKAKIIFQTKGPEILGRICFRINKEQPNISSAMLALEANGQTRIQTENLMESLFVIYYLFRNIRENKIKYISEHQIKSNCEKFASLLKMHESEKRFSDYTPPLFLKDKLIMQYCTKTLSNNFENEDLAYFSAPFMYFSLIKSIEENVVE